MMRKVIKEPFLRMMNTESFVNQPDKESDMSVADWQYQKHIGGKNYHYFTQVQL